MTLRPVFPCRSSPPRRGFTLIEMMIVVTIIAILAALMFPVFSHTREKARSVRCMANLRQLGQAIMMYAQDWDDGYPFGVDPADKFAPQIWYQFPRFQRLLPWLPLLPQVLNPYVRSAEVWHCPSDTGYDYLDDTNIRLPARPTAFGKFGMSYFYRTELVVTGVSTTGLPHECDTNILMDGTGAWHGSNRFGGGRFNLLYGDGHVKSADRRQYDRAFAQPLY